MNEQELRDNEFRADMENALHQNRSLTMIAQTIWELAKAYADAREKGKDTEIAYWKDRWEAQNKAHDAEFSSIIAQNTENKRLNAEIKRLRDIASRILGKSQIYEGFLLVPPDTLGEFLSPAPVTEVKDEHDLMRYILTLSDDVSASYIKGMIHENLKTKGIIQ